MVQGESEIKKEPMRVLQVFHAMGMGGAENMIMNLYRKIDREQIQFDFVVHTETEAAFDPEIRALGGRIYACPAYKGYNHFSYRAWWKRFFEEHKEYRILHSHIRSHASVYLPIAKRFRLKTIVHSHSTSNGTGIISAVKKVMQYPLRFQADYFAACSREAGEWLFGKRVVEGDRFKIIYNAIDCDRFAFNEADRENIRKEYGIEKDFVVGNIGRHTPQKNPLFLLEVFSEIYKRDHNARLLQLGQGEMTAQMKQKCRELGIEKAVIFVGTRPDTERYYSAMDVFLFPSAWEGLGIVAVEAQTNGLHCVVSDAVPAVADIGAGLFHCIGLEETKSVWVELLLRYWQTEHLAGAQEYSKNIGYDINASSDKLKAFYISIGNNGAKNNMNCCA